MSLFWPKRNLMSSYYRTINGQRYDADLLEMAEGLMEGHRDGRLSQADAEQLWEAAFDGMGMTAIEMATLAYIREHENPTRPAKEFFDEMGVGKLNTNDCLTKAGRIAAEFGLEELQLMRFYIEEVQAQEALGGKVGFEPAYRAALAALFEAKYENESPYYIASNTAFEGEEQPNGHDEIVAKLKELINYGVLFLVPHDSKPNPDVSIDFFPPENGETTQDNWIFNLYVDELSDHIYWMVVPRNGDAVSVYGFN